MTAENLLEDLKNIQEKKGYFLNRNRELTIDLLKGLLSNRERYGYMACPCRLASGDYDRDRDIICPCEYREQDLREYGSCYCNLYVSEDYVKNGDFEVVVPERRPVDKLL
ncbi:ferredoxin-thioredoxin reductase catalytic domain-containing protein [Desulfomarina sp.]